MGGNVMRTVRDRYIFEKFLHKIYFSKLRQDIFLKIEEADKLIRRVARMRIYQLRKRMTYEKLMEFKKRFRMENKLSEDAAIKMLEQWISMVEAIRGWGYRHRYECAVDAFELIRIESEASRMSEKRMEKAIFLMQV